MWNRYSLSAKVALFDQIDSRLSLPPSLSLTLSPSLSLSLSLLLSPSSLSLPAPSSPLRLPSRERGAEGTEDRHACQRGILGCYIYIYIYTKGKRAQGLTNYGYEGAGCAFELRLKCV